jgi:hypothetical protein
MTDEKKEDPINPKDPSKGQTEVSDEAMASVVGGTVLTQPNLTSSAQPATKSGDLTLIARDSQGSNQMYP